MAHFCGRPRSGSRRLAVLTSMVVAVCGRAEAQEPRNLKDCWDTVAKIRHTDPAQAKAVTERALLTAKELPANVWTWRFALLRAELFLDGPEIFADSKLRQLLNIHLPRGGDHRELRARLAALRGYGLQLNGDWKGARKFYDQSRAAAPRLNDHCWKAELLVHHQATTLSHLGNLPAVANRLAEAVPETQACPDKYWENLRIFASGNLYLRQYRYEQAIAAFRESIDFARSIQMPKLIPVSLGNIALCFYNLGDMDRALKTLDETDRYYQKSGKLSDRQLRDWGEDIGHRARVYLALKRYDEAINRYNEAIRIARQTRDENYLAYWLDELTTLYMDTARFKQAESLNRQVLTSVDPEKDSSLIASATLNSCRLARLQGDPKQARVKLISLLSALSAETDPNPKLIWQTHSELALSLAGLNRLPEAEKEFKAALRTANAARGKILSDEYRLTYFSQLLRLYQNYAAFLADQNQPAAALQVAESSHARLLAERLNETPNGRRPLNFSHVARAKNAVILSYLVAPERSYMWVTTASASEMHALPPEAELAKLVRGHNDAILAERDLIGDTADFGRRLYDKVVAPAAHLIPPGANVIVIPDGPLADLNFETLVVKSPKPHYWLEAVQVSVASSLALLRPQEQHAIDPKSLLLIGQATQSDARLKPLTDGELQSIDRLFTPRCKILKGPGATPAGFKQENPGKYSIIHISAHALPNPNSPLDSAIILSPDKDNNYRLYAHDLLKLHLTANLVTLSACQSAAGKNFPGEGLVGLSWSVLSAGARNVVASLWEVPVSPTSGLMQKFYTHLHARESPAQALRAAKIEMAKAHSYPYNWAAFQLYSR